MPCEVLPFTQPGGTCGDIFQVDCRTSVKLDTCEGSAPPRRFASSLRRQSFSSASTNHAASLGPSSTPCLPPLINKLPNPRVAICNTSISCLAAFSCRVRCSLQALFTIAAATVLWVLPVVVDASVAKIFVISLNQPLTSAHHLSISLDCSLMRCRTFVAHRSWSLLKPHFLKESSIISSCLATKKFLIIHAAACKSLWVPGPIVTLPGTPRDAGSSNLHITFVLDVHVKSQFDSS
mmetsp:Transcript_26663/g.61332  ORF Transcript_26663/g.61332 Transcript_26663/m.61332 type:complete len:236 (+) Transcript_26663:931-1638(+)